jgi:predicted O-methyltransferase YrrM
MESDELSSGESRALDHYFERIDGWFKFAAAYRQAVTEAPQSATFVEVGCYQGRSTALLGVEILRSNKRVALHCVDIWPQNVFAADGRTIRAAFEDNMASLVERGLALTLHAEGSPAAAAAFTDRTVDFVWLDGGHAFDEVSADIEAWLPKLKYGAVIGGDDWQFPNVARAVRQAFKTDFSIRYDDHWGWWWHRVKVAGPSTGRVPR